MTSPTASKTGATLLQLGTREFERTNVCGVFGTSRPELAVPSYDFVGPASADDGATHRTWGRSGDPLHWLDRPAGADLVFGARGDGGSAPPTPVFGALRRAHGRGARVADRRARANVAGRAGLPDSRRATTDQRDVDALTARFPNDQVDPDVLYVDEDPAFTSAGFAAGLDLRLSLRRPDRGADVSAKVAARLAGPTRRDGSQARIVTPPTTSGPGRPALVLDRAIEHLERPTPVGDLARPAGASRARSPAASSARWGPHRSNRCFVNDFCTRSRCSKALTKRSKASPASQGPLGRVARGRISAESSV